MVGFLGPLAEKKNIRLSVNKTLDEFNIYGDSNKIEQILNNLISNAIKFTPNNGKISINIEEITTNSIDTTLFYSDSGYELDSEQNYVKITVEDTGIGIKHEDIPKVFDKFQQIESSLSREVGGTGLGLPIAMQLIEAHKGKIWLESEPEKGSKFSFIIPLLRHTRLVTIHKK